MKIYKIPVEWSCYGIVRIEAKSLKSAIEIVETDTNILLPEGNYIDGSWKVNDDMHFIKMLNKKG